MNDFLDSPKKWSANNANLIIGFLFGLAVPFTAWILLFGFFKIIFSVKLPVPGPISNIVEFVFILPKFVIISNILSSK